jgi:hypothetical protein
MLKTIKLKMDLSSGGVGSTSAAAVATGEGVAVFDAGIIVVLAEVELDMLTVFSAAVEPADRHRLNQRNARLIGLLRIWKLETWKNHGLPALLVLLLTTVHETLLSVADVWFSFIINPNAGGAAFDAAVAQARGSAPARMYVLRRIVAAYTWYVVLRANVVPVVCSS